MLFLKKSTKKVKLIILFQKFAVLNLNKVYVVMVFLTKQLSTEWQPSYLKSPEFEQRKKKKVQTKQRKVREGKQDLLLFRLEALVN